MTVRVLILSDLWRPFSGGAEALIGRYADALHAHPDIEVSVLTGYEFPRMTEPFSLVSWPIGIGAAYEGGHEEGWAVIDANIKVTRPDVILTHHLYAYEFETELAATGIPVVQIVLNQRRLPCATFAVYISEWVRATAGPFNPGDMTIRPMASDDCDAMRSGPAIGFIKPIAHKGVELVYAIAESFPDRPFLVLRGEWQDLEILCDLPNVRYMEPVDNIRDFYGECRIVLMPSRSEDAGTVAQEATVNGLPCISSNVGGLPETNGGGIRLDPFDLGAWIEAIRNLDDPAVYDAIVARQRAYAHRLGTPGLVAEFVARVAAIGDGS